MSNVDVCDQFFITNTLTFYKAITESLDVQITEYVEIGTSEGGEDSLINRSVVEWVQEGFWGYTVRECKYLKKARIIDG